MRIDSLLDQLETTVQGLSEDETQRRLERFGPNEINEKTTSPLLKFLGYLWDPIPWMIETAAVLSLIIRHWVDPIIVVLLKSMSIDILT